MANRLCVVHDCARPVVYLVLCNMHNRRLGRNGFVHEVRPIDRFMTHVTEDLVTGCWNFSPVHEVTGYGRFGHDKTYSLAHRWSYTHFRADIPDGLEIDHLCSNRACVNPWHLEPVTHEVNLQRATEARDTCVNGHPYDASNTHTRPNGHRQCRTCRLETERRFYAARIA